MENNLDPIEKQFNEIQLTKKQPTQTKRKVEFDIKNYLNVRLSGGETEKKITIRIIKLTPDKGAPEPLFKVVHVHYLPSEKRSFICAKETPHLPEGHEKKCPFCDLKEEAQLKQKGASEANWNKYKEIYKQNTSMVNYIVRVVDRSDEEFGVKFWKFSEPIYKMIKSVWEDNKEDGINIFDSEHGKDLVITIEGTSSKSKITSITAKNKQTPISTPDRINQLMTDDKKWSDVYGVKPYEYLELLIDGKEPWFDKTTMTWVEKKEKDSDDTADVDETDSYDEYRSSSNESDDSEESEDLPF